MRHKRSRRHNARRHRRHRFFNFLTRRGHRRSRRYNRRHGRSRRYNRGRHHRRSRRYNTGSSSGMGSVSIKRPFEALKVGFTPKTLAKGAVVLGGVVGNAAVTKFLDGMSFMPSMLKAGIGSYAVGLGTAGLTGALVSLVAPGYGAPVAFGGVLQQMVRAYNQYVTPMSGVLPKLGEMGDMDDYLTPEAASAARPLGYMYDYLTPAAAAAARPLGNFSDDYIGEELASL